MVYALIHAALRLFPLSGMYQGINHPRLGSIVKFFIIEKAVYQPLWPLHSHVYTSSCSRLSGTIYSGTCTWNIFEIVGEKRCLGVGMIQRSYCQMKITYMDTLITYASQNHGFLGM